jgi:hypothetical protein
MPALMRQPVPLRRRPLDLILVGFFILNATFITYVFDIEQLTVPDTSHFDYPLWPPHAVVELAHWWGSHFDPLLMARPPWWKATIWIDVLAFGPFYFAAIWAFVKAKDWIRLPSIIWASVMLTNVTIILSEEMFGPFASPRLGMVIGANAGWFIVPIVVVARMWRAEHPFTREEGSPP